MKPLLLFNLWYVYRVRTEAIFENNKEFIYEFFILDDQKFEEYFLFQNLWKETLLLNHMYKEGIK